MFQIIIYKIIGPLPIATKKPLLKCPEMLKRIFSKKPTIWVLKGLPLPVIPQRFLKKLYILLQYTLALTLSLHKIVQTSLEWVGSYKDLSFLGPDWPISPKLDFFSQKETAYVYCVYWSPSLHKLWRKLLECFTRKLKLSEILKPICWWPYWKNYLYIRLNYLFLHLKVVSIFPFQSHMQHGLFLTTSWCA